MPTLQSATVRTGNVTLVEAVVEAGEPHRIRAESRLDGPVWPPRRNGSPESGWDGCGLTTAVTTGRTAFGFATPAPPRADEPSVELSFAEPLAPEARPAGISAWLDRMRSRVADAEELQRADDLRSATQAVDAAGGLSEVERLGADLDRDRRIAARVSFVPDRLHRRLEAVDVPLEAFARLAQSRRS